MGNYINLPPSPISLIESLRNIGYSIETAIADIIDNSITAEASQIDIRFAWNSGNPWLAIIDNGSGMTRSELIDAMRFGSMNPLNARNLDDLGRFGLGMKTASFSQCRHFSVLTKKNSEISCCEWDLEQLSKKQNSSWELGILDTSAIKQKRILDLVYNESLAYSHNGTIIFWEDIDRIKERVPLTKQERNFNALIDDARRHIELIFHRFLSPPLGKKKIYITMNGDDLTAFDPFNPRNIATQELEEQIIMFNGERILVQPYILPHHDKVSKEEYNQYSGEGGYLHNQGFYIYRNRRLIIKGTWFRLIKKEELNKLIRVRIDIPNSLDRLWKIDVKKSNASPPETIRRELKQVINKIETSGRRVYHQRGKKLSGKINDPVWNRVASGGTISYCINREHPLVAKFLSSIPSEQNEFLGNLLTMFESSFPVDMFFNDLAGNPEQIEKPVFSEKRMKMLVDIFIESWLSIGIPEDKIEEKLLSTDPFASNKNVAKKILGQRGYICER